VIRRLHLDKYCEAKPDGFGSHQRNHCFDHSVRTEALDASPAGRLGKADAARDLGNGERRVCLHDLEALAVHMIHLPHEPELEDYCREAKNSRKVRASFISRLESDVPQCEFNPARA
jgi:hypothetical protein